MQCLSCLKKQPKLVLFCKACIKKDLKRMNADRSKKGLLPYK